MTAIKEYGVKGKSGYFGHAGRPGKRGGSADSIQTGPSKLTFEQAVSDPANILKNEPLGGGVMPSRLFEYKDVGAAVWKPTFGGMSEHSGNAEVNAYILAQLMAAGDPVLDIVPETFRADDPDGVAGTAQRFVPNSTTAEVKAIELGSKGSYRDYHKVADWSLAQDPDNADRIVIMALLDELIANEDRHGGNWVYDSSGRLWAIDHGHAEFNRWKIEGKLAITGMQLDAVTKLRNGSPFKSPRLLTAAKKWKAIDKNGLIGSMMSHQTFTGQRPHNEGYARIVWENLQSFADMIIQANAQ